ncbi:MAG: parvulin-like peptidyl-prolyl isomerase [Candidatus Midichloriaceae bacterium]|jgi:parvulin-like peptidyl-prolyl isomerase
MPLKFKIIFLFVFSFIYNIDYSYSDNIVAYVNGEIITSYEMNDRITLVELANKSKLSKDAKSEVLKELIDEKLLAQIANKNQMVISKKKIDEAMKNMAKSNGFNNLNDFLLNYKIKKSTLYKKLESQILLQVFIEKYIQPEIHISKQEIKDNTNAISQNTTAKSYIDINNDKAKLYEIVMYKKSYTPESMMSNINDIYKNLYKGESFEALAQQFSESPTASQNGFIADIRINQLSQNILEKIKNNDVKTFKTGIVIYPPIETDEYLMIVKLANISKKSGAKKSLPEEEVKNIIFNNKINTNTKIFLERLRSNSYIKIHKIT